MKDAKRIYHDLWNQSLPLFEEGRCEIDRLVNDPADSRRGLTLRARLSDEVISNIEEYTSRLKPYLPNQYFTPCSDLHITILTVISCDSGFRYDPATSDVYCEIIEESIQGLEPPRISFQGMTASPSCLLLCGFPENRSLDKLRDRLRRRLEASDLPSSVDLRYPLKTAHATLMRFTEEQDDISQFTHFIKANRDVSLGTQIIDEIEFVTNDWCHQKANTQIIRTFSSP